MRDPTERAMKTRGSARSLKEIREWLLSDLPQDRANVDEDELLAVILGSGRRDMTALEVARWVLGEAENLGHLIRTIRPRDFKRYRLGPTSGIRLLAAAELVRRYYRDPDAAGDAAVSISGRYHLRHLEDPSQLTEGDLLSILVGHGWPAREETQAILSAAGGLADLVRSPAPSWIVEQCSSRKQAARVVALAEVAARFHAGAAGAAAAATVELALRLLDFGALVLRAVVRRPEPQLIVQCAELMEHTHRVGSELVGGERLTHPNLEAIRAALAQIDRSLEPSQPPE